MQKCEEIFILEESKNIESVLLFLPMVNRRINSKFLNFASPVSLLPNEDNNYGFFMSYFENYLGNYMFPKTTAPRLW